VDRNVVSKLIQELASLSIKVISDGDQLKISAPPGKLNSQLQLKIRDNKEALIASLANNKDAVNNENQLQPITPKLELAGRPFPLSDLQLGFYMANDPHMEFHVRPHCYMELNRDFLDIDAYELAWNKALARHHASIYIVNSELELEGIRQAPKITCAVNDFRNLNLDKAVIALLNLRDAIKRNELPLDSWPWLELSVSIWSEHGRDRYRIHYNHNNFFIDGYATNQLLSEIEHYYQNPEYIPQKRELAFRDAVLAINELEHSSLGKIAEAYWLNRLTSLPSPPQVPQNSRMNRRSRSKLDRLEGKLTAEQWSRFKRNASNNKVTPSNAVITAYAFILSSWCGSDNFILSQMVTRRFAELHPEIKSVLGNFASLYPLEIRLNREQSFVDNALAVQNQVMQDIKHLFYGGMQVFQKLNQLKGGFGEAPSPFVVGSGLFIKDYKKFDYVLLETSQTVLDHQFFEFEDGSYFYVWDCLQEYFPSGVIDSMFESFAKLLVDLCENTDCWNHCEIDVVSAGVAAKRAEVNATSQILSNEDQLLHSALAKSADIWPKKIALTGVQSLTYDELDSFSSNLAALLRTRGVLKDSPIAVVADRGSEMMTSIFGILKASAFYVPIDPGLPTARRNLLLDDAGATVVLTQKDLKSGIDWPADVDVIAIDFEKLDAMETSTDIDIGTQANDLAYVIYTSGTTGRPKGVMIEHAAAMNTVADINSRFGVNHLDVIFGVSAFNFDLSVYDIFGASDVGAKLVYPAPYASLDVAHWLDLILEHGVTIWNSVPALISLLIEEAEKRAVKLPSLRLVMLSGDKIPTSLPQAIVRVAPNANVISLGGATEASIWSILYVIERDEQFVNSVPYGFPMRNQSWHIRDSQGHDVPDWVVGELMIGGLGLARGYWNDSKKTASSFVIDKITGQRLYKTGDLGRYLPDGCLEILGRKDFQVKIQGHRIELGEIESTLLEVASIEKAVAGVLQSKSGKPAQLVAYIVTYNGIEANQNSVEMELRSKLPAYMVPTIFQVEAIPYSSNGKVDRQALMQSNQFEDSIRKSSERDYRAPQNDYERELVEIWKRILDLNQVGVDDDFFDLGGQSFDAIRIFSEIKDKYSRLFTLGDIWESRTIAQFAKNLQCSNDNYKPVSLIELTKDKGGHEIFLVHPAGGGVSAYLTLAAFMMQPTYGLQANWGERANNPYSNIRALATHYLQEIRHVQPNGPYTLGGWSSGGAIAFEIANILEKEGAQVDEVIMLDAPTPYRHNCMSDDIVMRWFVEDLALELPLELIRDIDFATLSTEDSLAKAIELLQPSTPAPLDSSQLLPIYRVFKNVVKLVSDYTPEKCSFPISVLRVEENVVSEFSEHIAIDKPDWGWADLTSGSIRTTVVPGNHHSFLIGENVAALHQFVAQDKL